MEKLLLNYFPSSNTLQMCVWSTETNDLMVVFKSKAVWVYKGVPSFVREEFITAPSAGAYFNKNIRNIYDSICLHKEGALSG